MANRKRTIDEKVSAVQTALEQINIEKAAREASVPASTLRYDLNKVKQSLAEVLQNQTPGPKPASLFPPDKGSCG
jgi:transposase-like protein